MYETLNAVNTYKCLKYLVALNIPDNLKFTMLQLIVN